MSILKSLLVNALSGRGNSAAAAPATALPQDEGARDQRSAIYDDLHHGQLVQQEAQNRHSAHLILSRLFGMYRPQSVLDVGCGLGTWLEVARELGVADVFGVEGGWLDKKLAKIPNHLLRTCDLEQKFDLGRRFDLVICLEVAEHLSADAATRFVESLTAHSDVILFSAAIPFQGGHHHVNEQFPDYWEARFQAWGYQVVDCIRHDIWNDDSVLWWLRQNIMVFAKSALTTGDGPFVGRGRTGPLSIVHPGVYLWKLNEAQAASKEYYRLFELMAAGKKVSVERGPNGELRVSTDPDAAS